MPDADRFEPLDPDMGDPIVIDTATGRVADPEAVRLHEMERDCERLTQQVRALEAPTTPEERLVDLMGALETSVREAKEARKRHRAAGSAPESEARGG